MTHPTPTLAPEDAPGTALLLGLDPTDPNALRVARCAARRNDIDRARGPRGRTRSLDVTTGIGNPAPIWALTADPRADDPADRAAVADALRALARVLTPRERSVLVTLLRRESPRDAARALGMAHATYRVHRQTLRVKARALLGL